MEKYNFKIAGREIGYKKPVFIVAEISANHKQSFKRAKKLVESACKIGVDAIKLQTYTPDTITINCSNKWFQIQTTNPAWKGKTFYELYKTAYTPWEWQPKLKKIADNHGVILFSAPFDETAVDFLEKMKVPAYKIASFEIGDIELLKKVAKTKKPVIISRGMASLKELKLAILTLKKNGASKIAVLHCISSYPAKPEEMNLATILDIKKRFKVVTGLSDHSLSIATAITSVALGASIIEKHFTLKRSEGGPDAAFSLEPAEMKQLVQNVREAEKSIGRVHYGPNKSEAESIASRRSLFVVEDIKKGEKFARKNIRCIRPGYGLNPKLLNLILGKKANRDIKRGTPLKQGFIKK